MSVTSTLLPRKHLAERQHGSLQTILAAFAPTVTEKELPFLVLWFFFFLILKMSLSQTTVYATMKSSLSPKMDSFNQTLILVYQEN